MNPGCCRRSSARPAAGLAQEKSRRELLSRLRLFVCQRSKPGTEQVDVEGPDIRPDDLDQIEERVSDEHLDLAAWKQPKARIAGPVLERTSSRKHPVGALKVVHFDPEMLVRPARLVSIVVLKVELEVSDPEPPNWESEIRRLDSPQSEHFAIEPLGLVQISRRNRHMIQSDGMWSTQVLDAQTGPSVGRLVAGFRA